MNEFELSNEDALFALPKNMKQIGEATNENKVYIEDYVYTYIHQFANKNKETEEIAFLVGNIKRYNEEEVLFVTGAISTRYTKGDNGNVEITNETWEYANKKMDKYFKGQKICGWVFTQPGYGVLLTSFLINQHRKNFIEENSILFIIDVIEKEETIFVHKEEELSPILGFYIYYDKNPMMHEYMLDYKVANQNILEKKADQVVKNYRNKEQEKKADISQKKMLNMLFAVSAALVCICIILGIGLINNVEETNNIKESIFVVVEDYNQLQEKVAEYETETEARNKLDNSEGVIEPVFANENPSQEVSEGGETIEPVVEEPLPTAGDLVPAEYTVQSGDNLVQISYKFYNTNSMVQAIQDLNEISNPNKIYVGQIICLPQP